VPSVTKLLVANRGEIARRIMRTAHAMGIGTVAVFSDADEHAPFVSEADEAVRLPGFAPGDTYLRGDLIVEAAQRTGADAVHPGYGFLSENAGFARACEEAGITFVGPSPHAIDMMGSKIEAKRLMDEAGVPVLRGMTVTDETTADDLGRAGDDIGYPVLVKAAFGGGGRGMRIVRDATELAEAVEGAQREAASAFGNGTVFLEKYVESPRHVEVQIFGDHHGTSIHLFERECSIQRRHQKIIEESPSPAVDDALRKEICSAAVAAGRAIGYVGAGTVEFVMAPDGSFYFLEVNTRLQVEHPVTELVTGLDLVELQLLVARGEPLPVGALEARMNGHAIEARLYAEDVPGGFLPTSGPIHRLRVPSGDGVRVDTGFEDGSVVSTHYDAMLAKIITWAPTRTEAANRLADVLARSEIHGVVTNRPLLVRTLRHPEFLAGQTDTGFYERHDPSALGGPLSDDATRRLHAIAATLAVRPANTSSSPVPRGIPAGFRNVGVESQPVSFAEGEATVEVAYHEVRGVVTVDCDGEPVEGVKIWGCTPDDIDLELEGVRRRYRIQRVAGVHYVDSPLGSSALTEVPRFPDPESQVAAGSLLAPMPGSVVRLLVGEGDEVKQGQVLLALEAMKMEHAIRAPHDGTVHEVKVSVGQQVETSALLLVVEERASE
jgi:acetyl/propionyl-CoA carboxylase alpha subunit